MKHSGPKFAGQAALLRAIALMLPTALAAVTPVTPVRGKCLLKGKALRLRYAHLVTGTDHFQDGKANRYVIFTPQDHSAAIRGCSDLQCAILNSVSTGAVLQASPDGSIWFRVADNSAGREISVGKWEKVVDQPKRLAGKLKLADKDLEIDVDLQFDAVLVKEFPITEDLAAGPAAGKLPAGGGKAGAAYLAYCKSQEPPTLEAFEKEIAKQGLDKSMAKDLYEAKYSESNHPRKCKVLGGRGDEKVAELDVEVAFRQGVFRNTVILVNKNGRWEYSKEKSNWDRVGTAP